MAIVLRMTGDLGAAEDAVQDAFTAAAATWPTAGVPPNPQAWVVMAARNSAVDRHRRAATADRFAPVLQATYATGPAGGSDADDELAMVFLCCHPALSAQSQVALTLRYAGGLTTPEIARAFGVSESTVGQRLSRAKATVAAADPGLRLPPPATWDERLGAVLATIYGIFSEGYVARTGVLVRDDLCAEAIRLARSLFRLVSHAPEVRGLLALLLLLDSRRPARTSSSGDLISLPEQDRTAWRRDQITEGHRLVRECLAIGAPDPYQIQAAIQAVHCDAATDADTDWAQIVALYDLLVPMVPTDAVAVNRAVAVAKVRGPRASLTELESVCTQDHYALAVRADLLAQLGEYPRAIDHLRRAAELTSNDAERAHLLRRAQDLDHR